MSTKTRGAFCDEFECLRMHYHLYACIYMHICTYMHPCTCLGRLPKTPPKSPKSHAHGHKTMLAQHHEVRFQVVFKIIFTHSDIFIHILPACGDNIFPLDLTLGYLHSTKPTIPIIPSIRFLPTSYARIRI